MRLQSVLSVTSGTPSRGLCFRISPKLLPLSSLPVFHLRTGRQCLPCMQTPPYTLALGDLLWEGCHTKALLCF